MKTQVSLAMLALLAISCAPTPAAPPPPAPTATSPAPTATSVPPTPVPQPTATPEEFIFGMVLVGPHDDHGWSQAHYEGGLYVEEQLPGARMIWEDLVNPAAKPERTLEQVIDDMVGQGARLVITTSAEYGPDTSTAARKYPDVVFIHASGDAVLTGEAPPNVGNVMGRMEYGKMIAGCAAALTTQTGQLAYLGPLVDFETRRLVNSVFLGARYCWQEYRGNDLADLRFIWDPIGFWFHIPGVTKDPNVVVETFFNEGFDVVLSGIDTTEALVKAAEWAARGNQVFAIPYDYRGACEEAPQVCLGVPFFNWGPSYLATALAVKAGTWEQSWDWNGPDWLDLTNLDTTAVGWVDGAALGEEAKARLYDFIASLADGLNLFVGPLNWQDGTPFLAAGEVATDEQIWYATQLLDGMEGPSE